MLMIENVLSNLITNSNKRAYLSPKRKNFFQSVCKDITFLRKLKFVFNCYSPYVIRYTLLFAMLLFAGLFIEFSPIVANSGLCQKSLFWIWSQIKFAHNAGIYDGAKGYSVIAL